MEVVPPVPDGRVVLPGVEDTSAGHGLLGAQGKTAVAGGRSVHIQPFALPRV